MRPRAVVTHRVGLAIRTRPARSIGSAQVLLAAFAVVAIALVAYKLAAQIAVGPRWDSYAFLANAAHFAGRGTGYTEPARPPLISLIAAAPLALGIFDASVIQVVDALLALVSLAGFYLLFRRRFERLVAGLATLALLASPVIWDWLGVGYTDFAAMGLCAWALYFAVRASEERPRLYVVAFPLLLAASLMRFTSLLFVLPLGVWLALRAPIFRHARYLALGAGSMALLYAPFAVYYYRVVGDPLYPYIASTRVQEAGAAAGAVRELGSYSTSSLGLAAPRPLAALVLIVFLLAAFGLCQAVFRFLRRSKAGTGRILIAAVIGVVAVWTARHGGLASSQLSVSAGVFVVWRILAAETQVTQPGARRRVPAQLALDAAMAAWLLAFFCFHEEWAQRVTRYYITMAPGVIYFVALGWRSVAEQAWARAISTSQADLRRLRVVSTLPVALVMIAAVGVNVTSTSWEPDSTVTDARRTAGWLARQPGIASSIVYSDLWPMTSWYMGRGVVAMPLFADPKAVGHELDAARPSFYVTTKTGPFPGYRARYETPTERVLRRTDDVAPSMPEVLYLGAGWENYLERLTDYRIRLVHHEGDYNLEGTAFLDAFTRSQLDRYSTIAAFGFLWHDRGSSERTLADWVARGGTLLIDASANLTQPTSLDGSVLFDTVVRRASLPRNAKVALDADFSRAHPSVGNMHSAPFVAEDGAAWYGAAYSPLPGSDQLRVLAWAGGHPLISQRKWGHGSVYWIAYNFAWHAALTGNADEARLISAVLDEAFAHGEVAQARSTLLVATDSSWASRARP